MTIALLGWSSLLWERNPDFDTAHDQWAHDGPRLPLEFSRISATRASALTLVIDRQHGKSCQVAWCRSTRATVAEVVQDLAAREQTKADSIRQLACDTPLPPTAPAIDATIAAWGQSKGLAVVVWPGFTSNFTKATGKPFSVSAAMAHIKGLPDTGKRSSFTYVSNTPDFIRTPVRSALLGARWFQDLGS